MELTNIDIWPHIVLLQQGLDKTIEKHMCEIHKGKKFKPFELFLLGEIYRLNGDCRYTDITKAMYVDKTTTSRRIANLVKKKYVVSYVDEDHASNKRVKLTTAGFEVIEKSFCELKKMQDELFANFTEEEKTLF